MFGVRLFLELVLLEVGSLTGLTLFGIVCDSCLELDLIFDSFLELDVLFLDLVLFEAGSLTGVTLLGVVLDSFLELDLLFLGLELLRASCS